MYSTTTFYTTTDLTSKGYGDFLLKKYTEKLDTTSTAHPAYVNYHDTIRTETLKKLMIDIPQLTVIDSQLTSTQLTAYDFFKCYMILRNIVLIFNISEDYNTELSPEYQKMLKSFEQRQTESYEDLKKYIRRILGVDSACIQILK